MDGGGGGEGGWVDGLDGDLDAETDTQAAHQLCLSGVWVCAGMGTWPRTTWASSSRAPSTHITAADLFELRAIVPRQMEVPDRPHNSQTHM